MFTPGSTALQPTPGGSLSFGNNSISPGMQNVIQEQTPQMTDHQAAAILELERERTAQDVASGKAAPLPFTQYTQHGAVGTLTDPNSPPQQQQQPVPYTPRPRGL
jgi:hypothetical protein